MTHSIIKNKFFRKTAVIIFWLFVWHIISALINSNLILVSPVEVTMTLAGLVISKSFWSTIFYSFIRIVSGFFIAFMLGIFLAAIASKADFIASLLSPIMSVIKATPVASFIILAIFWFGSKRLSIFTAFLMVLPVIYTNVLLGIKNTDEKLLEMAKIFRISPLKKVIYIYLPSLRPHLISAVSVSLGMCWKAGIAAEVIGQPSGSIGEKLYTAKLFLSTADVFAWTAVIIAVSVIFEKTFICLLKYLLNLTGKEKAV